MGIALPITREHTSEPVAANCIELTIIAESCKWFPPLAKLLSKNKPASALHYLTNDPERTCYAWVQGKFDPPARAVLKLLHSEVGWIVLEYLMRGCKQAWWVDLQRARHCAAAYEQARGQLQFDL